ncbi:unnamed protein product [Absidia cylindrospora]
MKNGSIFKKCLKPISFNFLATIFDDSVINVYYGELSSQATKAAMNQKRGLFSVKQNDRVQPGAKVDILYRVKGVEAGHEQGIGMPTKEINDGHLKQPKVMKNMLCELAKKKPDVLSKLCIFGFTIIGSKINMLLVDAPTTFTNRQWQRLFYYYYKHQKKNHDLQGYQKKVQDELMMVEAKSKSELL